VVLPRPLHYIDMTVYLSITVGWNVEKVSVVFKHQKAYLV